MDNLIPAFALNNAQMVHMLIAHPGLALLYVKVKLLEMIRQKDVSESVQHLHLLTQIST